ncbi:YidH family protein [Saccharomonospora saliphila]|uniref:YidH family protein n=1 Tax=Saccharomonospora saliphila TaxID=369829 RepID=UPI00038247BF|nr:DUF202 domain-containing protein [Saccharomonospora saliphila]
MTATDCSERPRRWPRELYATGTEPDPRFTLANERTFLAWLRTALSLMAAGVALLAVHIEPTTGIVWTSLAIGLISTGVVCSACAFRRWYATERALRAGKPLPAPRLGPVLGYGLAMFGLTASFLLVVSGA